MLSGYTFTKIADTTGPFVELDLVATGGLTASRPTINSSGDVVFTGETESGTKGIFVGNGTEETLADFRSIAVTDQGFSGFGRYRLSDQGAVAFETPSQYYASPAIYVGTGSESTIEDYVEVVAPDPSIRHTLVSYHGNQVAYYRNATDGNQIYRAELDQSGTIDRTLIASDARISPYNMNREPTW